MALCPIWDYGFGGGATPSYQTNTSDQLAYIINHSKARFIFAENQEQYSKLETARPKLSGLEKVILFEKVPGADPQWTIHFDDFLKLGNATFHAEFENRLETIKPDDTAFIIYTSGTTGVPKAVITTHFNLTFMGEILMKRYGVDLTPRAMSYLPLSHIAEQISTNILQLETGGEVFLCSDVQLLKEYLPEVMPHELLGVPRVWEKVEAGLKAVIEGSSFFKKNLLQWALATELKAFDREQATGHQVDSFARRMAHKLVINKIKQKLGMSEVILAFIGAAPSNIDNLRFFASLGIRINEVYGMTETTGILTGTHPSDLAFGTVGKPLDGVEVKIADDGEIIARGPNLTKGYMHDEAATRELWEDGWLHTGDIGEFDKNGNLKITDRKKDLIVTAGGKNVAPQPIEAKLKRIDGISQAVVCGDQKPYLVALLTLDALSIDNVAAQLDIDANTAEKLAANPAFIQHVTDEIEKVNETVARFEKVGRFKVLSTDFTIEADELTPTMKLKRKVVNNKYAAEIEEIYRQ